MARARSPIVGPVPTPPAEDNALAIPAPPPEVLAQLARYGLEPSPALIAKLSTYLEALLSTNRAFNLTAVTAPEQAWTRHIEDSLSLLPALREAPPGPVADVGSGGGLPAIPLAIACPERVFTLVETTGKKAGFLDETARRLGLSNVKVVNDRIESFGQGPGRERFSVVTSRALSRLPTLLELTLPLLAVNGVALAIKGERADEELAEAERALRLLGGVHVDSQRTPTGTIVRTRKVAPTPRRYPRRPGEPKREPL
jgi:16S rRNA (guanine527-N7)-methyltransferase